ncbi:MAG: hypothetical protein ACRD3O_16945 [Terriglobia bacterium]
MPTRKLWKAYDIADVIRISGSVAQALVSVCGIGMSGTGQQKTPPCSEKFVQDPSPALLRRAPSPLGEGWGLGSYPSPQGEGGPQPAHSPAGAGQVRRLHHALRVSQSDMNN